MCDLCGVTDSISIFPLLLSRSHLILLGWKMCFWTARLTTWPVVGLANPLAQPFLPTVVVAAMGIDIMQQYHVPIAPNFESVAH